MAIVLHLASLLAAELAQGPSSPLERGVADLFTPYYELLDQGHAHRFYSDVGPTPILLAELRFEDGRPAKMVRIPDRSTRPRLVYQRQLALANFARDEALAAYGQPGDRLQSGRVASFARYLCRKNPGCSGVTMRLQMHLNPEPGRLLAAARGEAPPVDADAEEFYATPDRLGDYKCPPR